MAPAASGQPPTTMVSALSSAVASAPSAPAPKRGLSTSPELGTAYQAEATADGFIALVRKDNTDDSVSLPLRMVEKHGDDATFTEVPFNMSSLLASNLPAKRFLFEEGEGPKKKVRIWTAAGLSEPIEDTVATGAVGETQALALVGKIDRFQMVSRADLPRGHRYRDGAWRPIELPPPAEKDFAGCFWNVDARPKTDELVLLQICSAPMREMAYAVFKLGPASDTFERVPFDNALFDAVQAFRGTFNVEEDGTIDIGNNNPGKMYLARLRPGASTWKVIERELPTRLMSSTGVFGERILMTDAGVKTLESSDEGATFREVPTLMGMLTQCNQYACTLMSPGRSGAYIYRW
ncbi:MAG: hypothetical protein HOW73_15400 [Polyangiaceae bacterium]|nr:hypothetical protein [Polyangiaceae bacterium]